MQDSGGPFVCGRLDFEEGKALFGIGKYQFSKFFQGVFDFKDSVDLVFDKGVGERFRGWDPVGAMALDLQT